MAERRSKHAEPPRDERQEESRRILERVAVDSESLWASSLARSANRARDHFSGSDGEDAVEVWGKRIGRIGSLIALVALAVWLFGWLGR